MSPLGWLSALVLAVVMGFVIQHGGTCTVDAVTQLIRHRPAIRLAAIIECGIMISVLMVVAQSVGGVHFDAPQDHAIGARLLAGGALLGLGAWINGACLVGTIARIGSRQFAYAMTPLGFFAGNLVASRSGESLAGTAAMSIPVAIVGIFTGALVLAHSWRMVTWRRSAGIGTDRRFIIGTLGVGVCYVALAAVAGAWSWSDAVARLAHGETMRWAPSLVLPVALLAGALLGGIGSVASWNAPRAAACFLGGALMGWGGALVPGGNDTLVLSGIPALRPYAWAAMTMMVATLALLVTLAGRRRS